MEKKPGFCGICKLCKLLTDRVFQQAIFNTRTLQYERCFSTYSWFDVCQRFNTKLLSQVQSAFPGCIRPAVGIYRADHRGPVAALLNPNAHN